jgi:hypothetical protein
MIDLKMMSLGLAAAGLIDATIVRAVLVPHAAFPPSDSPPSSAPATPRSASNNPSAEAELLDDVRQVPALRILSSVPGRTVDTTALPRDGQPSSGACLQARC